MTIDVVLLSVLALGLAALAVYFYIKSKSAISNTDVYKGLFELSDSEFKKSQVTIQELIQHSAYKDVLLSRGADSINIAEIKLREQIDLGMALKEKLDFQEQQYDKLFSQKKSSEVRTGLITEQISPFLSDYPLDPATARFIGNPIDFIHFDEDKVTFVEVKTGKSQLSKKQRRIRDLVGEGKVEFVIYRVEGK